jgi:hypothetical protein
MFSLIISQLSDIDEIDPLKQKNLSIQRNENHDKKLQLFHLESHSIVQVAFRM